MQTEGDPRQEEALRGDLQKLIDTYGRAAVLGMVSGMANDREALGQDHVQSLATSGETADGAREMVGNL